MVEQARHDDVATLDQPQAVRIAHARGGVGELRGPGAGGVDDGARRHVDAAMLLALQRGVPALAFLAHRRAAGAGQDVGAAFAGVQRIEHHQARIVHPAVGVDEALAEIAFQRAARHVPAQRHALRGRQESASRQMVIQE